MAIPNTTESPAAMNSKVPRTQPLGTGTASGMSVVYSRRCNGGGTIATTPFDFKRKKDAPQRRPRLCSPFRPVAGEHFHSWPGHVHVVVLRGPLQLQITAR